MIVLILQALLRQHFRNCAANFIQAFLTRSSTCLLLFPLENLFLRGLCLDIVYMT